MIRVLQVVTIMNRGGLETLLMNYYRNIDRSKVQFDFLVHRNERGAYDDEIEASGGRIYRMPPLSPKNLKKYSVELESFFKEHSEYKIVHSHLDTLSCFPLSIAKEVGIPIRIAHGHTTDIRKDLKAPVRIISKMRLKKYANYFFSCGTKAGLWLFGEENEDNIILMRNAIDVKEYTYDNRNATEIKRILSLKDRLVIGHVGNFTQPKNHMFLIDVFAQIHNIDKNAILILIGEGELRRKVEDKATKLGIRSNVFFLGVRTDISQLLQAIDIFVFPSIYEGLPVTLIEAQASGLKCIISDTITKEIEVTNMVEYISLKKKPEHWAQQIMLYRNGYERRDTSQEIVDEGYDIEENVRQLQKFYLQLARNFY